MVTVVKRFSCEEAVELVTAFLEGDLDEPTRRRFEEHLDGCEGCERYLDQFRVTVEALGRLRTTEAPDRLHSTTDTPGTTGTTEADGPHHDAADSTGSTDAPSATDAPGAPGVTPGPSRPGSLPKRTRDRLLAAFRARRTT
ncbi:zf-HC2 domain-containing protein [Streptosporangium vulgare]|uniref:Zf-HC2 domain-containing protein n=1 Tax=Streptosporangium vulgare TaxID=46190 RepID=A0ABV5TBW9_9ACTN